MSGMVRRSTADYRSFGLMVDSGEREMMLTVSLWWFDVAWSWSR